MIDLTKIQDKIPEILPLAEEDTSAIKYILPVCCILIRNQKTIDY